MRRILFGAMLVAMVMLVQTAAWAQITPYTEDFEAMALPADPVVPIGDGWLFFVNVLDTGCGYAYTYFGDAPNGGNGISAIVTGEGGPGQGAQQLSVYSDYNNNDHNCGNTIEVNVYQQQAVASGDFGSQVSFTFDAKLGNLGGSTTAQAFIKAFDAGWAQLGVQTVDMTAIPTTWGTYSISLTIPDGTANVQFGFQNSASNWDSSGVLYDNLNFQPVLPEPVIDLQKDSTFDLGLHDHDNSGTLTPGDSLLYTLVASNTGGGDALLVTVYDTPDANTSLVTGSVTTTQGSISSGNSAGDTMVLVDAGTLAAGGAMIVTFEVMLNNPMAAGVTEVSNQASLNGSNVTTIVSNVVADAVGAAPRAEAIPTLSTLSILLFVVLLAAVAMRRMRY